MSNHTIYDMASPLAFALTTYAIVPSSVSDPAAAFPFIVWPVAVTIGVAGAVVAYANLAFPV